MTRASSVLKACRYTGCPKLVPNGYCAEHRQFARDPREKQRRLDRRRGTSTERGYDVDWRRFRRWFLLSHPLCADCMDTGRYVTATEVHHLVKVRDDRERRLDAANCRALCRRCHGVRTARGE